MNSREKRLLEQLKNYKFIRADIERLSERLAAYNYSTTASYGLTGGGSGQVVSKVEMLAIKTTETKRELEAKQATIQAIDDAMERAGLNERELKLIYFTMNGCSLSRYAKSVGVYKSHVYKIRDRALKKMANHIVRNSKCDIDGVKS